MKKLTSLKIGLLTGLLVASSLSMAAPTSEFHGHIIQNGAKNPTQLLKLSPFEVAVDNNSNYDFNVNYDNTGNNPVSSGDRYSITADQALSSVPVKLIANDGYVFFDQNVPNKDCVEVTDTNQTGVNVHPCFA